MADASFVNPASIPYNSAGTSKTIAADYKSIFTHTKETDCPITTCVLKTANGCGSDLETQNKIDIGASLPFSITARENIKSGYNKEFCVQCQVTPLGTSTAVSFNKDNISVKQYADCSDSLADASFNSPSPIPFKKDGALIQIIFDYKTIFKHNKVDDCPISSCSLKQLDCLSDLEP